jgi:glycosyltransferase involved in cell wall biosynthesis
VDLGLESRIRVTGQLSGEQLEDEWRAADLSLLISRTETYGLVVTESLARGIPAVVRAGTGAVEALEAGAVAVAGTAGGAARARGVSGARGGEGQQGAVPGAVVELTADPAPLAELLRRWLTDPELRASWRSAALVSRQRLPGWRSAALTVLDALEAGRPYGN